MRKIITKSQIIEAINSKGNIKIAAEKLGMSANTLRKGIKELNIQENELKLRRVNKFSFVEERGIKAQIDRIEKDKKNPNHWTNIFKLND